MPKLIAANWKMYKIRAQAQAMLTELKQLMPTAPKAEVVIFPPVTALAASVQTAPDWMQLGAQNFYPALEGAFTGEVSPPMLLDLGATYCLVGHSERRHTLKENPDLIDSKTGFALEHGLKVILCIGETLAERQENQLEAVLKAQLAHLHQIPRDLLVNLNIAYEPVWAIGTGKVATPTDIVTTHALIHQMLQALLPNSSQPRLLYGGSVKPDNAAEILHLEHVDGLLVGGASLQASSFVDIIRA